MILPKKTHYQSLSWVVPLILFLTGITFCGVIWLIDIVAMVSLSGNYLISAPSPYFNYWVLSEFIFGGFCILALILILKKESMLLALALIVSCTSIAINTVLLKKISSRSHREWISSLEQYLQDENIHINAKIFCEEHYRLSIKEWNLVEADKIEPNTNLYRAQIQLNNKDLLSWDSALEKIKDVLAQLFVSYSRNGLEEKLDDGIHIKLDNAGEHLLCWDNVAEILMVCSVRGFTDVAINDFRWKYPSKELGTIPHYEDTDTLIIQKKDIGHSQNAIISANMSPGDQYEWDLIHAWCKRNDGKYAKIFFDGSVTFDALEEVVRIFDAQGVTFFLMKPDDSSDSECRGDIKLELFTHLKQEQEPNQSSEPTLKTPGDSDDV